MMMAACRSMVFVSALFVLMCCVAVTGAADMSLTPPALADNEELQGKEKFLNKWMVKYYENFFEKASDVSDYLYMALPIYKLENCISTENNGVDVKTTLNQFCAIIDSTRNSTKKTLRLMETRKEDEKTIEDIKDIVEKNKRLTPELLERVKRMTVPSTKIDETIAAINVIIEKVDKEMGNVKEVDKKKIFNCPKKETVTKWLSNSKDVLTEMKTAAEKAKEWQDKLFDEPQQTVGKEEENKPEQKGQNIFGEENNSKNGRQSFDGSLITVGFRSAAFSFVFVFVTASAVIAGI